MATFISGLGEWVKLKRAISRISEGMKAELVLSFQLADVSEPHHHEHDEEITPFTKEVEAKAKELEEGYNVHVHLHLHSHEASLTLSMPVPEELDETIKSIASSFLQCERCAVIALQGELHVDGRLGVLFYGDVYKLTAIYPHESGKYLEVRELNL